MESKGETRFEAIILNWLLRYCVRTYRRQKNWGEKWGPYSELLPVAANIYVVITILVNILSILLTSNSCLSSKWVLGSVRKKQEPKLGRRLVGTKTRALLICIHSLLGLPHMLIILNSYLMSSSLCSDIRRNIVSYFTEDSEETMAQHPYGWKEDRLQSLWGL